MKTIPELERQQRRLDAALAAVELDIEAAKEKRLCTLAEFVNSDHTHPDDLHHSPMSDDYLITLLTGDIPQ